MDQQPTPDTPETSTPETTPEPVNMAPEASPSPVVQPIFEQLPASKSKKPLLIISIVVLLLAIGAGAWWFFIRDKGSTPPAQNQTSNTTKQTAKEEVVPSGSPRFLLYSGLNSASTSVDVLQYSLASSKRIVGLEFKNKENILDAKTSGKVVYVHVNSSTGEQAWISKDEGVTYEKVFQGAPNGTNNLGDQITSAVFSKDNTSLLIAVLSGSSSTSTTSSNTVKEVLLSDLTTKDIFTLQNAGVFLYGYDKTAGLVYYSTGCYNCDGNTASAILRRNIKGASTDVIYTVASGYFLSSIAMNSDLTKILVATAKTYALGSEIAGPFVISDIDTSSKTVTKLKDITESAVNVGYSHENKGYYFAGKTLKLLDKDVTLLETGTPIYSVFFVGKDTVIAETGTGGTGSVIKFTISTAKLDTLFDKNGSDANPAAFIIGATVD